MKYLKPFLEYNTYSLCEDEELNYLFDEIIVEQARLFGLFRKFLPKGILRPAPRKSIKFDLHKKTSKVPKPKWDYQDVKISDNLVLRNNPKGPKDRRGSVIKEVINKNKPSDVIQLKVTDGEFGKHYYFSANMSNRIDAGRGYKELLKFIPKGSYFGEPVSGSLSTDSFYNILRRVKDKDLYIPEVKGWVKLNSSGKNKFQEFIRNKMETSVHNEPILFKSKNDAQFLSNKLNEEIKKMDPKLPLTKVTEYEGNFTVSLPQIFLKVK